MRSVPEWIAKSDDQAIPDRVKLRIWVREGGKCHITGKLIRPGDKYEFEHFKSLGNGGEHRESNIGLALYKFHKIKTAEDRRQQAETNRILKKHAGIKNSRQTFSSNRKSNLKKKLDGTVVDRTTGQPVSYGRSS